MSVVSATVPPYDFDVFARFYDWDTGAETDDLGFYLNFANRCGSPILDLACGTGRVAVELARAGHDVVGLDISPAMLARARAKAVDVELTGAARFVQADIREFDLDESFPLALIALNSFMHMRGPAEGARALRDIHRHLMPGGRLIVDLFHPDPAILNDADGRLVHDFTRPGPAEGTITSRFHSQRVDAATQTLDIVFFYDEVGTDGVLRRTVAPFTMSYYSRQEIELLLNANGFDVENVFGSYDLDEYWAGSDKIIVVARRR